jgi:Uma2 family endonuclease
MASSAISSARRNTASQSRDAIVPPVPVIRFSVDDYELMIREGILAEPERLELLDGWIVPKVTHNPRHDSAVFRLHRRLLRLLSDDWIVRVQSSISITLSLPEPDLVVARGPEDLYDLARPSPNDIALLVEVADSTLRQDQTVKLELYARDRIPLYWIVNLVGNRIEVYSQPRGGKHPGYKKRAVYGLADRVPVVLRGKHVGEIRAREVLP